MRDQGEPNGHRIKNHSGSPDSREVESHEEAEEFKPEYSTGQHTPPRRFAIELQRDPAPFEPKPQAEDRANGSQARKEHRLDPTIGDLDHDLVECQQQGEASKRDRTKHINLGFLVHTRISNWKRRSVNHCAPQNRDKLIA